MQPLRTELRNEVKPSSSSSTDTRGVRSWSAVEISGRFWIQARRTEVSGLGEYETRQWLTCDFMEALRYGRGDSVVSFSIYVGVFSPTSQTGLLFGEVSEVKHSIPSGMFMVTYASGVSVVLTREGLSQAPNLQGFQSLYRADAWRG